MLLIAPQRLEKGEKILWKYKETCYTACTLLKFVNSLLIQDFHVPTVLKWNTHLAKMTIVPPSNPFTPFIPSEWLNKLTNK